MNTKMTLVAVAAAAIASQAAPSLWTWDADKSYQVQVPCVLAGGPAADQNADGKVDTYDCAGWLYGYVYGPAATGTMAPLNGTELATTNAADGTLISGGALDTPNKSFHATLGAGPGTDAAPLGAGVGFDYLKPKGPVDLTASTGYCITYALTGSDMKAELGWDEATNGYDTYTAPVKATAGVVTILDLPWALFTKIGWAKLTATPPSPAAHINTLDFAKTNSWALKFKVENKTSVAKSSDIQIFEIGKVGECTLGTPAYAATTPGTPGAVQGHASVASLKASLAGRSLSFSGLSKKTVSAQVISLQGQVVASAVISAAHNTIDLSKIAGGVYVVKASGKGLSLNKMIAIK